MYFEPQRPPLNRFERHTNKSILLTPPMSFITETKVVEDQLTQLHRSTLIIVEDPKL